MSLTLFFAVAGGAAAAGWLAGRFARLRARIERSPVPAALPWGLPCALGDVLVRSADDEALLSSALVLRDGAEVTAVIFRAPRRGAPDRLVVAFPAPARELLWLAPLELPRISEPPTTLETDPPIARATRVSVAVERAGDDGPDVGVAAVFATYRDARGRAAIVLRGDTSLVALGEALPIEAVDRLPGR